MNCCSRGRTVSRFLPGAMLLGAALLVAGIAASAYAGKHNSKLDIGDAAPAISSLPGVDGKAHSLDDFADKDAVVVVFTCNQCPVAQGYIERINKFVADYKDKPVGLLAVSVSRGEGEDLPAMKQFAKDHGIKFPYAWDKSQESGKAYGATVTPHVFVLDQDRKVAYMGAWDDNWQGAEEVEVPYVRNAVDAVLAGRAPEQAETLQRGCSISYE